jgi:hypothetical protein
MKSLGDLADRPLRRARLLAARTHAIRSVPRTEILTGQWDGGRIVQGFMTDTETDRPTTGERRRKVSDYGPSYYLGFVHGLDQKPKRRLIDLLESQGVQANQDITFLTDGGKEILALTDRISPCSEHVLDWSASTSR